MKFDESLYTFNEENKQPSTSHRFSTVQVIISPQIAPSSPHALAKKMPLISVTLCETSS